MFRIEKIINSNTLEVTGTWNYLGATGKFVRIRGLKPGIPNLSPEIAIQIGQQRLAKLLPIGSHVQLTNPEIDLSSPQGTLVCDVLLNGTNICNYFPEFR